MLSCYRFGFTLDLWLVLILVGYSGATWFRFRRLGPGVCFTWIPSPIGKRRFILGAVNGLKLGPVLIEPLRDLR